MPTQKPKDGDKTELSTVIHMVTSAETATETERKEAERDRDFFDGKQWTSSDAAVLRDRGQAPVVINLIQKNINTLRGMEVRTRVEPEATPRPGKHGEISDIDAKVATDGIRAILDANEFNRVRSAVYENLLIEGKGACIIDTTLKQSKLAGGDAVTVSEITTDIKIRRIPWDRLITDPASNDPCFKDAAFMGVVTWFDEADAVANYKNNPHVEKDFEEAIAQTCTASSDSVGTYDDKPKMWYDGKRKRVKIVELYYKKDGEWYVCHFTKGGFIVWPRLTGYLDEDGNNVCPIEATSAYVNRDNERYGVVRAMVWPQEELNKRRSKALHIMSTRSIIAEESAFKNVQEARTQFARPDGFVVANDGALREGAFQIHQNNDMAQAHFQLMSESKAEIGAMGTSLQDIAASKGVETGRAVVAKHSAATLELEAIFDSLRAWQKSVYRQVWWRIRQFKREQWWLRVSDDARDSGYRFVALNNPMPRIARVVELMQAHNVAMPAAFQAVGWPDGMQAMEQVAQMIQQRVGQQVDPAMLEQEAFRQVASLPEAQQIITANDVSQMDVDLDLEVTPDTSAIQSEQFDQLVALRREGVEIPIDILLEASSLRGKRKLIEAIKATQQQDPAQVQLAAQVQQLNAMLLQTQVQLGQAQAQLLGAQAAKAAAEAQAVLPKAAADVESEQSLSVWRRGMGARALAGTELDAAKVTAQIQKDQATAMKAIAEAGAIADGADSPDTTWDNAKPNPNWPQ